MPDTLTHEAPAKTKRPYTRKPPAPAVPDHSAAIADAMARLAEGLAKITSMGAGGLTSEGLGEAMAAALEKNRVAKLASNPDPNYIGASVFEPHLNGKPAPKAQLVREVYVNNSPERRDSLRPDEVDAYNLLSASLPNPGMVRRAHAGKWTAQVSADGQRLSIIFPCKGVDDQANGPKGILALCKELTDGTEVPSVDGMLSQMLALKKQNETIMALLAKNPSLAAQVAAASA